MKAPHSYHHRPQHDPDHQRRSPRHGGGQNGIPDEIQEGGDFLCTRAKTGSKSIVDKHLKSRLKRLDLNAKAPSSTLPLGSVLGNEAPSGSRGQNRHRCRSRSSSQCADNARKRLNSGHRQFGSRMEDGITARTRSLASKINSKHPPRRLVSHSSAGSSASSPSLWQSRHRNSNHHHQNHYHRHHYHHHHHHHNNGRGKEYKAAGSLASVDGRDCHLQRSHHQQHRRPRGLQLPQDQLPNVTQSPLVQNILSNNVFVPVVLTHLTLFQYQFRMEEWLQMMLLLPSLQSLDMDITAVLSIPCRRTDFRQMSVEQEGFDSDGFEGEDDHGTTDKENQTPNPSEIMGMMVDTPPPSSKDHSWPIEQSPSNTVSGSSLPGYNSTSTASAATDMVPSAQDVVFPTLRSLTFRGDILVPALLERFPNLEALAFEESQYRTMQHPYYRPPPPSPPSMPVTKNSLSQQQQQHQHLQQHSAFHWRESHFELDESSQSDWDSSTSYTGKSGSGSHAQSERSVCSSFSEELWSPPLALIDMADIIVDHCPALKHLTLNEPRLVTTSHANTTTTGDSQYRYPQQPPQPQRQPLTLVIQAMPSLESFVVHSQILGQCPELLQTLVSHHWEDLVTFKVLENGISSEASFTGNGFGGNGGVPQEQPQQQQQQAQSQFPMQPLLSVQDHSGYPPQSHPSQEGSSHISDAYQHRLQIQEDYFPPSHTLSSVHHAQDQQQQQPLPPLATLSQAPAHHHHYRHQSHDDDYRNQSFLPLKSSEWLLFQQQQEEDDLLIQQEQEAESRRARLCQGLFRLLETCLKLEVYECRGVGAMSLPELLQSVPKWACQRPLRVLQLEISELGVVPPSMASTTATATTIARMRIGSEPGSVANTGISSMIHSGPTWSTAFGQSRGAGGSSGGGGKGDLCLHLDPEEEEVMEMFIRSLFKSSSRLYSMGQPSPSTSASTSRADSFSHPVENVPADSLSAQTIPTGTIASPLSFSGPVTDTSGTSGSSGSSSGSSGSSSNSSLTSASTAPSSTSSSVSSSSLSALSSRTDPSALSEANPLTKSPSPIEPSATAIKSAAAPLQSLPPPPTPILPTSPGPPPPPPPATCGPNPSPAPPPPLLHPPNDPSFYQVGGIGRLVALQFLVEHQLACLPNLNRFSLGGRKMYHIPARHPPVAEEGGPL